MYFRRYLVYFVGLRRLLAQSAGDVVRAVSRPLHLEQTEVPQTPKVRRSRQRLDTIDGAVGRVVDGAHLPDEHEGAGILVGEPFARQCTNPPQVGLSEEVVEQEGGNELIGTTRRFERGRQQVVLHHQLAHHADAAPLGFREMDVVEHSRHSRVPRLGAGLAELFVRLQRVSRIPDLEAVGIPENLNGSVNAVAAVHHRVDDGLTEHPDGQDRLVGSQCLALGQCERRRQVVAHRCNGPPCGRDERRADLDGVVSAIRILYPLPARDAHVIDAHHREAPPQRHRRTEQQHPSDCRTELPVLQDHGTQRPQQVGVGPGQLLGDRIGGSSEFPVRADSLGVEVRDGGVADDRSIVGIDLVPFVEGDQVVLGPFLVS